jgi:hypothetical protein
MMQMSMEMSHKPKSFTDPYLRSSLRIDNVEWSEKKRAADFVLEPEQGPPIKFTIHQRHYRIDWVNDRDQRTRFAIFLDQVRQLHAEGSPQAFTITVSPSKDDWTHLPTTFRSMTEDERTYFRFIDGNSAFSPARATLKTYRRLDENAFDSHGLVTIKVENPNIQASLLDKLAIDTKHR